MLKINTKTCVELTLNIYCSIENCPYMHKIWIYVIMNVNVLERI